MTSPLEETKGGGGAIPFDEPIENDPFSQLQQQTQQTQQQSEQQKQEEKRAKEIADASVLFGENDGGATDFFLQQQSNTSASPSPFEQTTQSFFDHLGRASSVKSQEYVSQQPTSLVQAYDPSTAYTQYSYEPQQQSTTDYYSQYDQGQQQQQQQQYDPQQYNKAGQEQQFDPQQYSQAGQEQQFDPNVHYYYDEQNQIHYYDPNTNLEYDMSQYDYNYQYDPQYSEYYQANYDPNAYATTAGVTAENNAQAAYNPNAYNVTEENNAQAAYDPNAYTTTAGATGESNAQAAYDPNAYAMTDKDSAQVSHYDPTATLEATHHATFDSFDSTAYAPDNQQQQHVPAQESYDPNAYTIGSDAVPVHDTQNNQQHDYAVKGSEANTEAAAYEQQSDVTFDFLQQHNTPSQNAVQHVSSSDQEESKPAVYDIGNDKATHTALTGDNITTFDQHQYEGKGYHQDMYSSTFASDFDNAVVPEQYDSHQQQEQQQQGTASTQVEGNIPTEVEYFNYQDQPYSSNDDIVKSHADASNSIQQELGTDTSTTQVELNPSPDNTKDTDSQFAEVQLAPMNDTAAVIATTTETSQPDLFAYTPIEDKAQLTEYTPQSMDQSNMYEPVTKNKEGGDQQFEEVQLVANLYTPTEARTVPPHSLPSQPMPPQSYTDSQAPPITSFERAISPVSTSYTPYRPSMDYASPRSSLDHRSSLSEARVASPAIPLVPCPDPQCEGENKPKAKFCCECGRPLAGLSRSNTPFSRSTTPFATFPQNTVENSPQQPMAIPRNPLDDKKDEMAKSLRQFYEQVALLDTALSNEEKKNRVLSYMDSRINELPKEDSKHLLWKIIKLLVEENGALGESEQLDKSILSLLGSTKEAIDGATLLDKLEVFLLEGDREGACQFAMENDMWAHALMISQSVNTGDLYKRTASQFINRTLFSSSVQLTSQVTDDKKSLRILYSLFGGAGADTVNELVRKNVDEQPHFSKESLNDWKFALRLFIANRTQGSQEAIRGLGDVLRQNELMDESRICYILSPEALVLSGIDANIVETVSTDLDVLYLMELYDFALSLKANDRSILSLQPFKFVHAWWLKDLGFVKESEIYVESVVNRIQSDDHRLTVIERLKTLNRLCEMNATIASLLNKSTFDELIDSIEEKTMIENNTGDQAGYGLYGHGMTTNAHQVTSPFTYGQATSAYVPAEPSHDTPEQGTYSYGYSYGDDYTPQVDTSYQPANTYTPSDTTYQPSDATVPPYQTNPATQPSYNNNNNNNDDDDDLGFGNSSIKKKSKGISESEENKEQGDQPREVPKDEPEKESAKGGGWGIFSLFSRKSHVEEKKPIKANLGDENQFYFDEKEKRWVWKSNNAQPAATPTNATPPPPKAMTPQPSATPMSPPSSAPKPTSIPPRVNSAPVGPPSHTAAPPTSASPAISTPPPAGARRAGGGRKPMRSRYVDVFNQPSS